MHRLLHILAQACSVLLHPLFMPTYGMVLFCSGIGHLNTKLPLAYTILAVSGTLFFTFFVPAAGIWYLWKTKRIDSLHIEDSHQRTAPYISTIISYALWIYFLHYLLQLPSFMSIVAIGAIIALVVVTITNLKWKISAHLTGIGGLLGGVCSFVLYYSTLPLGLVITILAASLILMYARLYLHAHTPLQVVCGLLLGILSTFIPNLIIYYA
jgi:membrane-associated phospholipid phosphatase